RNSAEAVEFYKTAFGAVETYRIGEDPSAGVVSRLSVEGAEFWLSEESPENGNHSPASLGGATGHFVLIVPDPESFIPRTIAAGAAEVWPIGDGHGWHLGRITDPYGYDWEIGYPTV
ncbi:VOC family protein, partial [bacterium]